MNFQLSELQREEISRLPFVGKKPSQEGQKIAVVTWGPPCSGKTTLSRGLFNCLPTALLGGLVPVLYDDHIGGQNGALFNIDAFAKAHTELCAKVEKGLLSEDLVRQELSGVYNLYRADSQDIRKKTYDAALNEGYSVFIETTSASPGTLLMIKALKAQGYDIHYAGLFASAETADNRFLQRAMPTPDQLHPVTRTDLYDKRIDAQNRLAEIIPQVESFSLYLGNAHWAEIPCVLTANKGAIASINSSAWNDMQKLLVDGNTYFANHKGTFTSGAGAETAVSSLTDGHIASVDGLIKGVESLRTSQTTELKPSLPANGKGADFSHLLRYLR